MLRIDRAALTCAARDLGLKLDVRPCTGLLHVRNRPTVFVGGRYDGVDVFNPAHMLTVNRNQTADAASRALWHELTHALQCERIGSFPRYQSEYARQLRAAGISASDPDYYGPSGYCTIPFEAEAFAMQARDDLAPLILTSENQ